MIADKNIRHTVAVTKLVTVASNVNRLLKRNRLTQDETSHATDKRFTIYKICVKNV
jgi:hypothetical protein